MHYIAQFSAGNTPAPIGHEDPLASTLYPILERDYLVHTAGILHDNAFTKPSRLIQRGQSIGSARYTD